MYGHFFIFATINCPTESSFVIINLLTSFDVHNTPKCDSLWCHVEIFTGLCSDCAVSAVETGMVNDPVIRHILSFNISMNTSVVALRLIN